ncbi:ABC transporter ATP-binding protein [Embleya sp. NPDC020886]|uniref:ABC transporter ATP-binding protein n=1 Tax=Embleya sp. NPDC020886 TaxID=3363980 RepID=UPI00379AEDC5
MSSAPVPVTRPGSPPVAARPAGDTRLEAVGATLGYDRRVICDGLSVRIPDRSFTVVVGPNGCGKSTLLRALSRLVKPSAGAVVLDGRAIASYRAKEVARVLGLLPQTSIAPDGITVDDLVARGRYPHQGLVQRWSAADREAVHAAMAATGVLDLAGRQVDELSGGQRQRVWVAMLLAQQTPLMLLDEPTTFLDIGHQIELLDLFADLNTHRGHTLVTVLHDLNHACRYATHIIAMKDGTVVAEGSPRQVITADLVHEIFDLPCRIIEDPESRTPLIIPLRRTEGERATR